MKTILIAGATGYVGGRLVTRLLEEGWRVRAAGRSLEKLKARRWADHPHLEFAVADALDRESMIAACRGCWAAFYLVHSMIASPGKFEENDRLAARNMAGAAAEAGLERILYLGGLGEDHPDLSSHLRSRIEVAEILKSGPVPVTVFRAAMILGAGSASFEILRYLVDRLPVMVTPRWVSTPNQPIGIRNVIEYLAGALRVPETSGRSFDIGGPEVLTYRRLMEIYAEEAGLAKRWVLTVPVLTPRLSSYWIHLVTPVPAAIARPLAEGLKNPVVCRSEEIRNLIPQPLLSCREAIRLALDPRKQDALESHWTDAGRLPGRWETPQEGDPQWAGGTVFRDRRIRSVGAPPDQIWKIISRIGGRTGWYHADWLWRIRGLLDRLAGGVGLRRGRRDPEQIRAGDALDFWRVLEGVPGRELRLAAEMKLPGKAYLEFRINPVDSRHSELVQTAVFVPRGLMGLLYWILVLPLHRYVFQGMIEKIAHLSEGGSGRV